MSAAARVELATTDDHARRCWPAFKELRPHLESAEEFIARWRRQQTEGYRLVYVADGDAVVAAAGYRPMHTMAWGAILYIDDLVAVPGARRPLNPEFFYTDQLRTRHAGKKVIDGCDDHRQRIDAHARSRG